MLKKQACYNCPQELWDILCREARELSAKEPLLAPVLEETVLSAPCFAGCIARVLAKKFQGIISYNTWHDMFLPTFQNGLYEGQQIVDMIQCDLKAIQERDPACKNVLTAFLFFKGFKSLMSHRAAHVLWSSGREEVAEAIQSRCSEIWGVDIHPGARLGQGLMLDHGTGIVIGETAVVGINCSFLHGVTLGSSGKEVGDRHPKVGDRVLIGCGAMILGNITIGNSAKIGSGSVVIKPIPENSTAVGNPARIVGKSVDSSSAAEMDVALKNVVDASGNTYNTTWALWANGRFAFEDVDIYGKGKINIDDMKSVMRLKFQVEPSEACMNLLFNTFDADGDGFITKSEFYVVVGQLQDLFEKNTTKPSTATTIVTSTTSSSDSKATSDSLSSNLQKLSLQRSDEEDNQVPKDKNTIIFEYLTKISESITPGGSHI